MICQHDRRGLIHWNADQTADPCSVVGESVCCHVEHVAWEARLCGVVEGEGDAVAAYARDSPVLLVIAYEAAVQGIFAAVLVLGDVRGLSIDSEGPVLDP